jgi:hypothetical protein
MPKAMALSFFFPEQIEHNTIFSAAIRVRPPVTCNYLNLCHFGAPESFGIPLDYIRETGYIDVYHNGEQNEGSGSIF